MTHNILKLGTPFAERLYMLQLNSSSSFYWRFPVPNFMEPHSFKHAKCCALNTRNTMTKDGVRSSFGLRAVMSVSADGR